MRQTAPIIGFGVSHAEDLGLSQSKKLQRSLQNPGPEARLQAKNLEEEVRLFMKIMKDPSPENRQANLKHLLALDWALVRVNGWGLSAFVPSRPCGMLPAGAKRYMTEMACPISGQPRKRSCVLLADGTRTYEVPVRVQQGVLVRPTLHLAQDQGSSSWYAGVFLVQGTDFRGTVTWDLCHRLINDLAEAWGNSGMTLARLEHATLMSIRRGPYNRQGHRETLLSTARDMFGTMDHRNGLLQLFYEEISEDLGLEAEGSDEHYQKVWEICRTELCNANMGHCPKNSRWFSIEELRRQQRHLRTMTLMLLVYLGIKKNWWKSLDDSPVFTGPPNTNAPQEDVDEEDDEAEAAEEQGEEAEDGEEPDNIADGPTAKRVTVARGRKLINRKRQQKTLSATLRYAVDILCRRRSLRLVDGCMILSQPLERFFKGAMTMLKTKWGTAELMQDMARQGLTRVIQETLQSWIGPEWTVADEADARVFWKFTVTLCGELALTQVKYAVPPKSFVLLVDPSCEIRKKALVQFKQDWDNLDRLESWINGNHAAKKSMVPVHRAMEWPQQTWVRENFVQLLECDFEEAQVYSFLKEELRQYALGMNATLYIENLIREARAKCRSNMQGRAEGKALWHQLSMASRLPADFDRPTLPVKGSSAPTASTSGPKSLPRNGFCLQRSRAVHAP